MKTLGFLLFLLMVGLNAAVFLSRKADDAGQRCAASVGRTIKITDLRAGMVPSLLKS